MAELREKYGSQVESIELVEGSGGVFDVEFDGALVYSKAERGRFPQYAEIPMLVDMKRLSE